LAAQTTCRSRKTTLKRIFLRFLCEPRDPFKIQQTLQLYRDCQGNLHTGATWKSAKSTAPGAPSGLGTTASRPLPARGIPAPRNVIRVQELFPIGIYHRDLK
jgi:hypothetical protein